MNNLENAYGAFSFDLQFLSSTFRLIQFKTKQPPTIKQTSISLLPHLIFLRCALKKYNKNTFFAMKIHILY